MTEALLVKTVDFLVFGAGRFIDYRISSWLPIILWLLGKLAREMTLHENRAEFVRRVWDYVIPAREVPSYGLTGYVPERLIEGVDRISRKDLDKVDLRNPEICTLCFAKIHRSLNRLWTRLTPEFAILVERSLDELRLWEGFDQHKIRISGDKRDVVNVRFDIADIAFAAGEDAFDRALESLDFGKEEMRIEPPVNDKVPKIITAVQERVAARAHIDLAVLAIQKIPRGKAALDRIAARLEIERDRCREFLRDLLLNNTLWTHPDGRSFLSKDEIPPESLNQAYSVVDRRLIGFNRFIDKLKASLDQEIPPAKIVSDVSAMMREYVMPEQNVTTNISVSNSQIGILNTGSIKDVQSIDSSITTLKSQGDMEVGDAFKQLTEGIMKDDALSESDKAELLSNIKYLSGMAEKKQEERSPSVLKSVLRSVSEVIGLAGPAVKALLPLIPLIGKFFGIGS